MRYLESLPNLEILTVISKFTQLSSNNISNELSNKTSCKYYTVDDYHTNINGLEMKLDHLHEFLSDTSNRTDIIALTETSEKRCWLFK